MSRVRETLVKLTAAFQNRLMYYLHQPYTISHNLSFNATSPFWFWFWILDRASFLVSTPTRCPSPMYTSPHRSNGFRCRLLDPESCTVVSSSRREVRNVFGFMICCLLVQCILPTCDSIQTGLERDGIYPVVQLVQEGTMEQIHI